MLVAYGTALPPRPAIANAPKSIAVPSATACRIGTAARCVHGQHTDASRTVLAGTHTGRDASQAGRHRTPQAWPTANPHCFQRVSLRQILTSSSVSTSTVVAHPSAVDFAEPFECLPIGGPADGMLRRLLPRR